MNIQSFEFKLHLINKLNAYWLEVDIKMCWIYIGPCAGGEAVWN